MPANSPSSFDVLVVGAGPTGLMMASELARRGVGYRLVEKLLEPAGVAKASGIWPRSLEIFEQKGIVKKFVSTGRHAEQFLIRHGNAPLLDIRLDQLDTPYPMLLGIEQYRTERFLTEHLRDLGGRIERGVELIDFQQDGEGIVATLRHGDGSEERIECQYVIGCDGAHSSVRHLLDVPFRGKQYPDDYLLGHLTIDWEIPPTQAVVFLDDTGSIFAAPLPENRWLIVSELAGEQKKLHHPGNPTLADLQSVVDQRCPVPARLSDPLWTSFFHIHHRIAERFRVGRAFLCGDAGHIHSPVGGQGMNTGMQDAYNLAWKLALVCSGRADAALLDSYQAERHPVGEAVLGITNKLQEALNLRNDVGMCVRNHLMGLVGHVEVVRDAVAMKFSETAYTYKHGPLAGEKAEWPLGWKGTARRPGVRECHEFGHGPRAGDRAPDARFADGRGARLYDLLRTTRFTLLLFEGTHVPDDLQELDLLEQARRLEESFPELIQSYLISPIEDSSAPSASATTRLVDRDATVHHRYGARGPCAYLLRPDGYILCRTQPIDVAWMIDYLAQVGLTAACPA